MQSNTRMCSGLMLGLGLVGGVCSAADKWVVEDVSASYLGTLGGNESYANDINDLGHVVGWSHNAEGVAHAFVYRDRGMQDLGHVLGAVATHAYGINNHGEVVGAIVIYDPQYDNPSYDVGAIVQYTGQYARPQWALYWPPDGELQGMQVKPVNEPQITGPYDPYVTGSWSVAHAINNKGGAGGTLCCRVTDPVHAWWGKAQWPPIVTPFSLQGTNRTRGYDINESFHIAGSDWERPTVFYFDVTTFVPAPLLRTGEVGSEGYAHGVNDSNQVVGWFRRFNDAANNRAFFWDGVSDHSRLLGVLPSGSQSRAYEINNAGFVAGWADKVSGGDGALRKSAFVWHEHFGTIELPAPGFLPVAVAQECQARSINNLSNGVVSLVGACVMNTTARAVRWDVKVKLKPEIVIGPANP